VEPKKNQFSWRPHDQLAANGKFPHTHSTTTTQKVWRHAFHTIYMYPWDTVHLAEVCFSPKQLRDQCAFKWKLLRLRTLKTINIDDVLIVLWTGNMEVAEWSWEDEKGWNTSWKVSCKGPPTHTQSLCSCDGPPAHYIHYNMYSIQLLIINVKSIMHVNIVESWCRNEVTFSSFVRLFSGSETRSRTRSTYEARSCLASAQEYTRLQVRTYTRHH